MNDLVLRSFVHLRARAVSWRSWADETGEGVISAAIAVLIVAFLGAGMWVAFNNMFKSTAKKTCATVNQIGQDATAGSGTPTSSDCTSN